MRCCGACGHAMQVTYVTGMIGLYGGAAHPIEDLPAVVKECRGCHKAALGLQRQLVELGPVAVHRMAQDGAEDLTREQRVLTSLADKVRARGPVFLMRPLSPRLLRTRGIELRCLNCDAMLCFDSPTCVLQCAQNPAGAEEVFRTLDVDGSGYLSMREQCSAMQSLDPGLSDNSLRFLLSYIYTTETDLYGGAANTSPIHPPSPPLGLPLCTRQASQTVSSKHPGTA